jgi:hypothetical protein
MEAKNRKFFKNNNEGISKSYNGYLLKWIDDTDDAIRSSGPHGDIEEANQLLSNNLKMGICSWLVKYYD